MSTASDQPATVDTPLTVPAAGQAARGTRQQQIRSVAGFVGICLGLALLATAASLAAPDSAMVAAYVPFVLALAPAVVGMELARREGHGSLGRLLRSVARRPADARWYLVLLLPVIWAFAVVGVAVGLGEPRAGLFDELLTPSALIIPLVVLLPAFAEELAWRGFAVPRLMSAVSPLTASLVLAVPWALLHLVLLLPGAANEGAAVWPTVLSIVAYSVVLTWIFVGAGGSVLLAALVHAGLNGVVPVMWGVDADLSWALRAVLAAVIAVAVIAVGGFRRTRTRSGQPQG
jgi:membrane protease YdiL (CAAX protease family)